jgi:hypothetical protein
VTTYRHTQRAPLCLLLYAPAAELLVLSAMVRDPDPLRSIFPIVGLLVLVLVMSFHHLTVADEGDRLAIRFGPLPLFGRKVPYADIVAVEVGRTTILDGWGIHLSLRGGWVWNLWGRDCVVLRLSRGTLRIGSDEAVQLAQFLASRIGTSSEPRI